MKSLFLLPFLISVAAGQTLVIGGGPSECYHAGYNYGRSYRSAYARARRADIAGGVCVDAYKKGLDDGRNRRVAAPPNGEVEQLCYMTGHSDASILP